MTSAAIPSSLPRKQIVLPLSKAAEIAYKNIRLRLSRSLIVTSGIVLAIAFLNSILVNDAMVSAMRKWAQQTQESPEYLALQAERKSLADQLPALAGKTRQEAANRLAQIREQLNLPQQLESMMKKSGIPTTPEDIRNDRIQTRWQLGLALLIAFVGILNAMLMSVTERFREIGTMKCLGALDGFIVRLFLLESLYQGVVGAVIGIIVGGGLGLVIQSISFGKFAWENPPVRDLLMSSIFCLLAGIGLTVAGAVYPAWRAARMQPIEAMRVEA